MSILAIDAAGQRAGVAVVGEDGQVAFRDYCPGRPGLIETLPGLLARAAQCQNIQAVAVTLGPGSFTGLRTAIALAQGFAAAAGLPLLGVSVADAFAAAFPTLHRPLWVAIRARKGRIFLLRDEQAAAYADADVPRVKGAVALAGDAANEVAARLAAAGADVLLTNGRILDPAWVAMAARARLAAEGPARAAQPLYVDPPEARLPASGLRPEPI